MEVALMRRRAFLSTGVAAGFVGLSGDASAEGERRSAGGTPIGFLGGSHSHAAEKVKVVRESADWNLIGVCEEDPSVRRQYEQAGVPLVSQDDLFKRSTVIAVESAVEDHARHARLALSAGKHIHLEKPPADTLEAFRELLRLARERSLVMQMGYMWRYNPAIHKVSEAARNGWLGEVYLARGTINTQIEAGRRSQWGRFRGGVMFELGSHLIDALVRLLGRPTKVRSVLKTHGPQSDALADNTVAIFEFPRALGIVSAATLQPNAGRYRRFEVFGTGGTAIVNPIEPPELTIDLAKAAGPYRTGVNRVSLPAYRRYVDDFAELARAVRNGKPLAVTPEQDLLVHEALMQACA
jgi:predicted dehydrogenase